MFLSGSEQNLNHLQLALLVFQASKKASSKHFAFSLHKSTYNYIFNNATKNNKKDIHEYRERERDEERGGNEKGKTVEMNF